MESNAELKKEDFQLIFQLINELEISKEIKIFEQEVDLKVC